MDHWTPGEINSSIQGGDGAGQLDQGQLTLMEATVNCAPFETFVNGTATPRYDFQNLR